MDLLFLGTPPIAARCLRDLAALASGSGHRIVAVGTHPDRPAGRGLNLRPTAVRVEAMRLNLPIIEIPDAREPGLPERIASFRPDLLVVVAFVILPPAVLAAAPLGAINLHGSLLPRWRGAAPIQRALESGATSVGATVFRLDAGVDTGGILKTLTLEVGPDATSGEAHDALAARGGELLADAVDLLDRDPSWPGQPQDPALATRAPKLLPAEGLLDWTLPARRLHDKVRAFQPSPGAWTTAPGSIRLGICSTHPWFDGPPGIGTAPGTVVRLGRSVVVRTGWDTRPEQGWLELLDVQPEGRKRLLAADWLNGQRMGDNLCFGTP